MKFLLVSSYGYGGHLLHMIKQEGNDVSMYITNSGYKTAWDGLLPKAKKIAPDKDTVVIFDCSGMGKIADELKSSGIMVVGGSKFADKLEDDRKFGVKIMEDAGIQVPLTAEFDSMDGVEEFLDKYEHDDEGEDRKFVFKPSGKELPTHLTYCSCDREDLVNYIQYVLDNYGKQVESFILQEFICGTAVSTELWSDGTKFIRPGNHTVEIKKFMDGDLGPATGCAGNLVWVEDSVCRLINSGVGRVEDAVVESGYVGPIDLNAIVNDDGVWGLEWTPRFGYDATPTLLYLFCGEIGKFFSDLAHGQFEGEMPLKDKFGAGIRLSIPPYPLDPKRVQDVQKVRPNVGIPIRGLTEKNAGSFYFYEVMEKDDQLVHSEGIGMIAAAIGVGESAHDALHQAYHSLSEIKIPEKQYRRDLRYELCEMYECVEHQDRIALGCIPEVELVSDGG